MIIGLGSDLIDITRIQATLDRFGERFTARVFTDEERRKSDRRLNRAESYARRYAAKEACAKALGTGLARGVFWRDIGVANLPGGRPTLALSGGAARRAQGLMPPGCEPAWQLTITDEHPYAQALVLLLAHPAEPPATTARLAQAGPSR